jgi:hypothetical protein
MLVTACTIPMGIIQTKLITTAMSRAHQVRPVGQMYEVAKLSARQGTKMHRNHHCGTGLYLRLHVGNVRNHVQEGQSSRVTYIILA